MWDKAKDAWKCWNEEATKYVVTRQVECNV